MNCLTAETQRSQRNASLQYSEKILLSFLRPLRLCGEFITITCFGLLCLLVLQALVGCQHRLLDVRSEALYPAHLASEKIDTIDPSRLCFYGQQIVAYWRLSPHCFEQSSCQLVVTVRYGNQCVETFTSIIPDWKGYWIHQWLNEEYWEKGGILSYKVELYADDQLLEQWRHHVWAELIELVPQNCE